MSDIHGTPRGPTSEQLRRRALQAAAAEAVLTAEDQIRLGELERQLLPAAPALTLGKGATYDAAAHKWIPRCPYGDVCSGCDARGFCVRVG